MIMFKPTCGEEEHQKEVAKALDTAAKAMPPTS
jgi:hypothetical protein